MRTLSVKFSAIPVGAIFGYSFFGEQLNWMVKVSTRNAILTEGNGTRNVYNLGNTTVVQSIA